MNRGGYEGTANPYSKMGFGGGAGGKMPSYKDALRMSEKPTGRAGYQDGYEDAKNQYYEGQYPTEMPDYNAAKESTANQRRVHFSEESPQVYQHENNYETEEPQFIDQYDDKGYMPPYGGPEDYEAPAGRNYMNENIEYDQFTKKFNRTKTEMFNGKETVKDLFSHPDSESPLDAANYKKQQVPIEYDIKKTDKKIIETDSELKK